MQTKSMNLKCTCECTWHGDQAVSSQYESMVKIQQRKSWGCWDPSDANAEVRSTREINGRAGVCNCWVRTEIRKRKTIFSLMEGLLEPVVCSAKGPSSRKGARADCLFWGHTNAHGPHYFPR